MLVAASSCSFLDDGYNDRGGENDAREVFDEIQVPDGTSVVEREAFFEGVAWDVGLPEGVGIDAITVGPPWKPLSEDSYRRVDPDGDSEVSCFLDLLPDGPSDVELVITCDQYFGPN